jgi:peptidoglycan hydrolase-like protein with peptidoglycan-binding domain
MALILVAPSASAQTIGDIFRALTGEAVRSAQRHASRPKTSKVVWLVVASRESAEEAISLAQLIVPRLGPTLVLQSANGRYAVIAGHLDGAKAKQNASAMKAIKLVPQDAFLTDTGRFVSLVWNSESDIDPIDLPAQPNLRRTVSRLQSALSSLGFYSQQVDGDIGPATSAAFAEYEKQYGSIQSETLDESVLSAIERTVIDGFRTPEERQFANARGFPDAGSLHQAQTGGFETYLEFTEAQRAGFSMRYDYEKYRISGFSSKAEFEKARGAGFGTRDEYVEYERSRLAEAKTKANVLLSDAEDFLRQNPNVPNLVELAQIASGLKAAETTEDADAIARETTRLADALHMVAGFDAFAAERLAQASAKRDRDTRELAERLSRLKEASRQWIAANLMHEAVGELADVLARADEALKTEDFEVLSAAAQNLEKGLEHWGLSGAVERIATADEKKQTTPGEGVSQTPANAFLVSGPGEELVAVYNASPSAPYLAKNLSGAFVFGEGRARLCAEPNDFSPSAKRALDGLLVPLGVVDYALQECAPGRLFENDVLLFRRDSLLASRSPILTEVLSGLQTSDFREFAPITNQGIQKLQQVEAERRAEISRDVDADAVKGFGAIMMSEGAADLCVVATPTEGYHAELLKQVSQFTVSEGRPARNLRFSGADESFRALQRLSCSALYASQTDLKKIAAALRRDERGFEFLPLWFTEEEISQQRQLADERQRQTEAKSRAEREASEERKRREAESKSRDDAQQAQKEAVLRSQNGVRVRALQTTIEEGMRLLVLGVPPTVRDSTSVPFATKASSIFPEFARWNAGLAAKNWEPTDISSESADYGSANWNGRSMEAFILSLTVKTVSAERGERKEVCFALAVIVDDEFDMYRDPLETSCETVGKKIMRWKAAHSFTSLWNSTAAKARF